MSSVLRYSKILVIFAVFHGIFEAKCFEIVEKKSKLIQPDRTDIEQTNNKAFLITPYNFLIVT